MTTAFLTLRQPLTSSTRGTHTSRILLGLLTVLFTSWVATAADDATTSLPLTLPEALPAFFANNCLGCHEGEAAEAGLDLTTLGSPTASGANLASWMRIIDRVHDGEMPPPEADVLAAETREGFVETSSEWLSSVQEAQWQRAGRVPARRLTHLQLERTLHDLLGIDIPLANQLPDEPRTNGFSTVASGQSISHFQLQDHLDLIDVALDEAFRRASRPADEWTRVLVPEQLCRQDPRRRCREPELIDGKAVTWNGGVIYYGRLPATRAEEPGWYRFTVRASALNVPESHGVWCSVRSGLCVSSAPLLEWATAFEATAEPAEWTFETWLPAGHMLEIRPADTTLKQARFAGGQIGTGEGGPQNVAGVAIHQVVMERIHRHGSDDDVRALLFADRDLASDPQPAASATLADLIKRFAQRAFRRPLTHSEVTPYVQLAEQKRTAGASLAEALRSGYRALLCSPRFLYFQEQPGTLDDYALASRLSYFLWNSMPDEPLLTLAAEGRLRDPDVIRGEVHRMLADGRSRQFVEDFAREWLDLALIDFTQPDRRRFRNFDQVVQQSMLAETHAYLTAMLADDLDIRRLVQSDQTYLNSRLARYYDIEGVAGDAIRPVTLPTDAHRGGGVLTQGAILKVTANGTNTSPVLRGVWISERLLGLDIPPPPANVPAIEPDIRGAASIREMLAKHREDASCAACHAKFDAPGYALENYDPTGRWRETYPVVRDGEATTGLPIDASYQLADGRSFTDISGLEQLLAEDPHALAKGVAARLLAYGTGAPVTFADRSDLEQLAKAAGTKGYGFRSLIAEVAASRPFRIK